VAELDVLDVVEICAGAGGQALGLERAGFEHVLAVELDPAACATLRANRPGWKVAEGDVAEAALWRPRDYRGVTLLACGVPCPPFTVAGRQLGAADERDLFAWAVELCGVIRPRALLLENVRGLSTSRFGAYRQHVLDRLRDLGYVPGWRLLHASDFGVPQLRPRTVLVALRRRRLGPPGRPDRADDCRRLQEARRRRPGPDPGQARLGRARRGRHRDRGLRAGT
jgi:DNA (cytosine-5)-methyltransferase 1